MFSLKDKVIVVTGARGFLGRPVCAALDDTGAIVVEMDLTETSEYPFGARTRIDVTDYDNVRSAGRWVRRMYGIPHGIVLLHGLDAKPGTDDADPWRDWQAMIDVNLTGTANACRVFGGAMAEARRGSIVTVGSLYAGHSPGQRLYSNGFTKPAGYSAGKAGVLGLTRYLAGLWGSRGVRVNCLSPGGIGSDSTPQDFRERFEQRVPLGRMGTPGDLVGAVIWLLSDASAYITGQEIRVDGGVGIWP